MIELIGLAIGGFLGFLASEFLTALDPVRQNIRSALSVGRDKAMQFIGSKGGDNPLIMIGVLVLVVVILIFLLGFSSAMLLGLVLGVIYNEEVAALPFVSTLASTIKSKISGSK